MNADHIRRGLIACVALLACACGGRPAAPRPEGPAPRPEQPPPEKPAPPIRLGALLPESGAAGLSQYAALVREGIDIAIDRFREQTGRSIELVAVDDGGDPARAAVLIRDLERQGAVAVIGPLLGDAVTAAARARTDSSLVVISPTASEHPAGGPNVYALNVGDTRGAEALARYAAGRGYGAIGLLYPRTEEYRRQAQAFKRALESAGGKVAADVSYAPGTTTFTTPLGRLRSAGVRAVYIPAAERDIRQLAPQLAYFGLGDVQVLGSEDWASDPVLRAAPGEMLNGVIASTPLVPASNAVAWGEFVGLYEAAHRRTLDNPYPALGYDATRLVLDALASGDPRRADVAQALADVRAMRGATGVLSLEGGVVSRTPFLVRIEDGRLVIIRAPGG